MESLKRYRACLLALALLALSAIAPAAFAAGTTLQWDPNMEPDVSGYTVHYGRASRVYTTHFEVVGKAVVSQQITGLLDGTTYYFAVTARDSFGNVSGYSNEVVLTTPALLSETIATPQLPSGTTVGTVGVAYTYSTTSSAVASSSDPVQYRFFWSDGSDSGWLPTGVTSASKSWSTPGTYTPVRVQARCSLHPAVVSALSPALTVAIAAAPLETVSAPSAPSGPTSGAAGTAYTYSTGGAVSSAGHSIEYRFSWSDGSLSPWLSAVAASTFKTWNAPGTYTSVRAEARCAQHPSVTSAASPSITVTISSGVVESVSNPSAPAGPAGGFADDMYVFSTGGSESSTGDLVVYRLHWGDGTTSEWVGPGQPVTAGKSWGIPGTYLVQAEAACATHRTFGSFSSAVEVSIADKSLATPAPYVLWTRRDTGQAIRWKLDPVTRAMGTWGWVSPAPGVGGGWLASSYARGDAVADYVLWTNISAGQAIRWQVNPSTGAMTSWSWISAPAGVGAGWQASSYARGNATTDYVLWTNVSTGQAIRWKVDPSTGSMTGWGWISTPAGVGAGWQVSSYTRGDATTDYVLWTNGNTGQAIRWKVDPSTAAMTDWEWISPTAGVGRGWLTSSYLH